MFLGLLVHGAVSCVSAGPRVQLVSSVSAGPLVELVSSASLDSLAHEVASFVSAGPLGSGPAASPIGR